VIEGDEAVVVVRGEKIPSPTRESVEDDLREWLKHVRHGFTGQEPLVVASVPGVLVREQVRGKREHLRRPKQGNSLQFEFFFFFPEA
jgi:hypothetical protein